MAKEASEFADIGKQIADGIAAGIAASSGPKKKTIGQYTREHKRKVSLTRPVMDNGKLLIEDRLTDKEIVLLNQIRRSGRYLGRKIEVIVRSLGDDIADESVEIRYSDRTPDQRLTNARLFRDFEELVNKIVIEQELAEEAPVPVVR